MKYTHPEELLGELDRKVWLHLPAGLHRPEGRLSDPNFYPGGTGYLLRGSWQDIHGSIPFAAHSKKNEPSRNFMIIGHFQANLSAYTKEMRTPGSQFRRTWTRLASLLEGTDPNDFFLTNARLGLPTSNTTTGFHSTIDHDRRCALILADLITIVRPKAILCLGPHAAKILAIGHSGLGAWQKWTSFATLDERHERVLPSGNGIATVAVVRHASAIPSAREWEDDKRIVNQLLHVARPASSPDYLDT